MQGYRDTHALYVIASSDNTSEAGDRFAEGMASANSLISQLDAGKVSLADGETIKIVGHSQGGAFAAGMAPSGCRKTRLGLGVDCIYTFLYSRICNSYCLGCNDLLTRKV